MCTARSWSYFVNMTLIGNAVFISMDIPDVFLAVRLDMLCLGSRYVTCSPHSSLNCSITFNGSARKWSHSSRLFVSGRTWLMSRLSASISCTDILERRYFRHWLNLVMIYKGWHEFDLSP
jgi:hypothetical protein